jgi:hypothetical protein
MARYRILDPNRGRCPNCGSNDLGWVSVAQPECGCQCCTCCLASLLWWPLILIVPFLNRQYFARHCYHCGHEWPI